MKRTGYTLWNRFIPVVVATIGGLASCARTAATTVNPDGVRKEIARINDQTSRWWDAGLMDSIARTYVEDATMLGQNEVPIRGRAAIGRRLVFGKSDSTVVHLRSTSDEVRVADTIAVEKGHFVVDVRRKPPADTTKSLSHDQGNYLTIWVLRSGMWRILYDMDASEPDTSRSRPTTTSMTEGRESPARLTFSPTPAPVYGLAADSEHAETSDGQPRSNRRTA
jgi:Domain of unknown function (DUF4440)